MAEADRIIDAKDIPSVANASGITCAATSDNKPIHNPEPRKLTDGCHPATSQSPPHKNDVMEMAVDKDIFITGVFSKMETGTE